eukprot:COSAG01_NODE_2255_length_8070_cov_25.147786_1_plen_122_part_10
MAGLHARRCHQLRRTRGRAEWLDLCRVDVLIEAPWLVNGGHGASLRHHNQPHLCRVDVPAEHRHQVIGASGCSQEGQRLSIGPQIRIRWWCRLVAAEVAILNACRAAAIYASTDASRHHAFL